MHYRNMPDEAKRKMPYCLLLRSKKANIVFNQRVNQLLINRSTKKPRLHLSLWALFYHF